MTKTAAPLTLLCATPLLLLLTGCSPHPATGTWATASPSDSSFTRLEVTYEGRALLFAAGEQEAGRRCFWGGENAQAIAMTCKPATAMDSEERYQLIVAADGTATLLRDGTVRARLARVSR